jgi:AraC-like DNA-binding protein
MLYLHFLTEEPIDVCFSNEMNESTLNANSSSSVFLRQVIDFSEKYDSFFKHLNDMISGDVDVGNTYSELNFSVSIVKVLINLGVLVLPKMSTNIPNISYYPPSLRKTLLYIQKNYRQKISTEELSKVANISQQHLIRMFNKHLNSTPIEYINSVKIAHAMDMLRSPQMSIKEISYELGFDNPNYFSRLFKKMQGFTPQESRKNMMNYDLENK